MKHFTVKELDINSYRIIATEEVVGGSRPRQVLYHKDGNRKFFFKTYSHNPREVWAECLASHIAQLAGLKAQSVTIKLVPARLGEVLRKRYPEQYPDSWKPVGTLAHNIFPENIETTYGAAIVETPSKPLKLQDVEEKIRQRYYAPEDLLQAYSDMIVFDAFIGNMDRHHENWGICEDKAYKQQLLFDRKRLKSLRYFTPLFDHGSSLMFELSQDDVAAYLSNEQRLLNYVEKSKFGFLLDLNGQNANMFEVIRQHLSQKTSWSPRLRISLLKIKEIDMLAVAGCILQMPLLDLLEYDAARRALLFKSMIVRYNKLSELCE